MNFAELVTSSVLTRALALFLLFAVMLAAIAIAAFDLMTGQAINGDVISILTLGLGYALTILGLNFGVRLTEPSKTTTADTTGGTTNVSQP